MSDERALRALLRFEADRQSVGAVNNATDSVNTRLKQLDAQAQRTQSNLQKWDRAAQSLGRVAQMAAVAGAAISGPLLGAAALYVSKTGAAEATSRGWLAATKDLASSYERIGRVVSGQILPGLERVATLSKVVAGSVEKNPGAVNAALAVGGGLLGLSLLANVTRDVMVLGKVVLDASTYLKGILAAQAAASGAGGLALGGAALTGGAIAGTVLGGVGLGLGVNELLARTIGGPFQTTGKIVTDVGYLMGRVFDQLTGQQTDDKAKKFALMLAYLTGEISKATFDLGRAGLNRTYGAGLIGPPAPPGYYNQPTGQDPHFIAQQRLARITDARAAALPVYQQYQAAQSANSANYEANDTAIRMNYLKSSMAAEADYNKSRTREVRDFNAGEKQIERDYNHTRLQQLRDFAENEQRTERDYYEQRTKAAAAFDLETQRAEQDHQDDLRRLQADHQDRARDLAAAGDALGFVKEQRAYERERAESEKQYQKDTGRRNQDYALQLADAEHAFAEQRADRLADFAQAQDDAKKAYDDAKAQRADQQRQRLADEKADFEERQRHAKADFKQQLADNLDHYGKVQKQLTDAFTDQLNAIDPILTGMTNIAKQKFQETSDEFAKFLQGVKSQIGGGPGYCAPGFHWDNQTKSCMPDRPAAPPPTGGSACPPGSHWDNQLKTCVPDRTQSGTSVLGADAILSSLGRSSSATVNLGGISLAAGAGGVAGLLPAVLELVESQLTEAFNQLASGVGS